MEASDVFTPARITRMGHTLVKTSANNGLGLDAPVAQLLNSRITKLKEGSGKLVAAVNK